MLNHVKVVAADPTHPEGVCELWVKGKMERLTVAEAEQVANDLLAYVPKAEPVAPPTPVRIPDAATT
jgi:hypothetical protein